MLTTVGQRLKMVMQKRSVTIQSLAKRLGISRNRLADILGNRNEPDYFDMKALRIALSLTPEEALWVFYPEISDLPAPAWFRMQ